jgi:hypothetical protein
MVNLTCPKRGEVMTAHEYWQTLKIAFVIWDLWLYIQDYQNIDPNLIDKYEGVLILFRLVLVSTEFIS